MFAGLAQLSLCEIADGASRSAHAERLQMRRLPALRLQPGVAGADGWAGDPSRPATGSGGFAPAAFAELFWLHDGPGLAALERQALAARRAVDVARDGVRRAFDAGFVPLKGCVPARVLIGADALPWRPHRAIHLELTRVARRDRDSEALFRWHDQVRIPALLGCRGVAGAWSFATLALFRPGRDAGAPALRLLIVYLDGDADEFGADLAALPPREGAGIEELVYAATLRAIVPWRWGAMER